VAAAALLSGCSSSTRVEQALATRCLDIGGAEAITLPIVAPDQGLLHIETRERGISTEVTAIDRNGIAITASSAVERVGSINLATDVTRRESVAVRIAARDSPGIRGAVCIAAELVRPADSALAHAARLAATADVAAFKREWSVAFRDQLAAARLFKELGRRDSAARAHHAMASVAYELQRERDSLALTAVALADTEVEPAARAALLALRAGLLIDLPPEKELSVDAIRRLLAASARLADSASAGRRQAPRLKILEGFLQYRAGQPRESMRLFDEAAAECAALRDSYCFSQARQNLAAVAEEQQNYSAALTAYEEALGALDATRMPDLVALISDNMGRLQARTGLIERSERSQRTALRLYGRLGDCDGARRSASSLGEMLVKVGSIADGTTYLEQVAHLSCRDLLAGLADSAPSAAPHADISHASESCSKDLALADLTPEGNVAMLHSLLGLAEAARMQGAVRAAEACLTLATPYAVDVRSRVRLANASGELYLEQRRAGRAGRQFEQALHIAADGSLPESSEFQGVALLGLAEAELMAGEVASARTRAYAALELASAHADVSRVVAALRLLAAGDSASNRNDLAVQTLRTATDFIERVPSDELDAERRAMYLATQHAVFAELTDLLAHKALLGGSTDDGVAWDAFAVAEAAHARSLRFALDQTAKKQQVPADSTDYRGLLQAIAALSQGGAATRGGELLERMNALAEPQRVAPSGRDELIGGLRALDATLIEYATGRDALFAFVTDGGRVHVVALGERQAIAQAAADLGAELRAADPVPSRIRASARRLAGQVLWPLRPYVTRQRIVLVPDDALHSVPFAVLPWTDAAESDLVLQHAEVSSVPSARVLLRRVPAVSAPPRFVLLGDPVLHATEWRRNCELEVPADPEAARSAFDWTRSLPNLPGSGAEVLNLADLVHHARASAQVQTLLRCGATAAALRSAAPGAEVLHIATHGLVDAQRPRLSALALTPDSSTGGEAAFRLLDVLDLPLTARLVVLSSCDTSRGRLLPGEGVLGLAQAFLQAGSAAVLASYWRVDDETTAPFMQKFYRHMLIDRMPAATALRRAQLDQAADDPTYRWAAFSVVGRPDASL
jgi:CHAT domain-containing protein